MSHHFLILHFGAQCPWHLWAIDQARLAAAHLKGHVEIVNAMQAPELADQYRLFFPFMTIINGRLSLPSPMKADQLIEITLHGFRADCTREGQQTPAASVDRITPLTAKNVKRTCSLCIPQKERRGCQAKALWASRMSESVPQDSLGFVGYHGKTVASVVEFLPASLVPYPLPERDPSLAFITCIYSLENGMDFREQLLHFLLDHLPQLGYKRVQVVSGQRSAYPNGPLSFFTSNGFREVMQLGSANLREGIEELTLLEKKL
jgi:hypothetical protein